MLLTECGDDDNDNDAMMITSMILMMTEKKWKYELQSEMQR